MLIEPFLAPVIEGRRIDRYVHLSITLELVNEDVEDQVERRMAPLRNAFIQDLHFQAHMHDDTGRDVHLRRIKARFQMLADRVLGPGTVREILITGVVERGF